MPEPVSLETVKAHLRVLDASEDALIAGYIAAARVWVENRTGHILVRRSITQVFDRFSQYLELYHRPVVSVDAVAYTDTDGAPATATFFPGLGRYPLRVYPLPGAGWPQVRANSVIEVTYTAGYAADALPEPLIQAMLLLIGHWYVNRSAVSGDGAAEVPLSVESLCGQYTVPGLG